MERRNLVIDYYYKDLNWELVFVDAGIPSIYESPMWHLPTATISSYDRSRAISLD